MVSMEDGVRDDGVVSLIVAAGERHGLLGVGFENMMRSWVVCRWLGHGKAKAQGRRMG